MPTMLNAVRTVAPATPVVTAEEARVQFGLGSDESQDDLIEALIAAATEALELELGRAFVTQTWRVQYDGFDDYLILPLRPVQSITSITYYDVENESATVDSAEYRLHASSLGTYVRVVSDTSWPSIIFDRDDAVSITFVAGYGNAAAVPAPLRQAIILASRSIYNTVQRESTLRREDIDGVGSREWIVSEASVRYETMSMKALIEPYRVMSA